MFADYSQAILFNPSYAIAFNNRGFAYAIKGEYDQAIAEYDKAIRLNHNYLRAFINRGNVYSVKKQDISLGKYL